MKLTKGYMVAANKISLMDADLRFAEFKQHKNLEPNPHNLRLDVIKEIWPEAEHFDVKHIEGYSGMYKGKFLIIFRGTDSLWGWVTNFMFRKKVIPYEETGTNTDVRVHRGFIRDYLQIRDYIHDKMRGIKETEVVVHGHSKGASIAALCALDIKYNFPEKEVGSFVIGMPRVGNDAFKKSFEKRIPDFTRIEYGSDLIPQLPPKWMGYADLGHFIHVGPKRRRGIGTKKHHGWHFYYHGLVDELKDDELYS
jgi:triacylglycerol lipase